MCPGSPILELDGTNERKGIQKPRLPLRKTGAIVTSINMPKDDRAVRDARIQSANTPSVQAVRQNAEVTQTAPVNPQENVQPPRTAIRQRAKGDRRKGERRQRQENVLLDTRNHRERRKKVRRTSDLQGQQQTDQQQPESGGRGIDVYT